MVIKSSFSVILCCSLLAAVFVLYETGSHKLMVVPDGNGRSKAAVKRSHSKRASSWAGYNVPPPSTLSGTGSHAAKLPCSGSYSNCIPKASKAKPKDTGTYVRGL
ncbi:hypothetical protein ES288_A13G027800v1 [Gossypium darwinii]|uniref:Uncharacterized protein n=1 Tax=Gossypium darwinii TaxID=34276 RepID=A0A5D2DVK6_GOSDA|nr:hypothetical protein ES288_A13G027800v1 [Gossypium darwinii]